MSKTKDQKTSADYMNGQDRLSKIEQRICPECEGKLIEKTDQRHCLYCPKCRLVKRFL